MIEQMDETKRSEQQEVDHINAFFGQFTLAEQDQLMAWVDELTTAGHVRIHESNPLHQAFDCLVLFINHKIDDLMPRTVHYYRSGDWAPMAKRLRVRHTGNALVSTAAQSTRKERDMPNNIKVENVEEDVDDTPMTTEDVERAIADLRTEGYDIREKIGLDGQICYVLHGLNC